MHLKASWDQEYSYEESLEVLTDLSLQHIARITNSHIRDALEWAVVEEDWRAIVDWNVDYTSDTSVADVIELRQVLGFFTKLENLQLGLDKRQVALDTFLQAELQCKVTNQVFDAHSRGGFCFPRGVDSILHAAQRKIMSVLGPVPALNELALMFGPGATTSVPKIKSCSRTKLSTVPSCSANMINVLPSLVRTLPAWFGNQVSSFYVEGDELVEQASVEIHHGKLAFVPKNCKTFRSVMTEPTLNAMLQAGYGRHIKKRLLAVGQDLSDQSRNQRLARSGSLTGELATLDLSSASDTIAKSLVEHLLPYDWYVALSECRTPTCLVGKEELSLEKFSSMGNGFTFPLQSLIFWALVDSCQEAKGMVSVYGDDIICPSVSVPRVLELFSSIGFSINTKKSYWTGPFRESCGADYYLGVSVRPFYQKSLVSNETLFALHNFYVGLHDDEMARAVLGFIPEVVRLWGPSGYGDGHLIGHHVKRTHNRASGWGGWLFDTYSKIGVNHTKVLPGDRVLPCYSIYARNYGLENEVRSTCDNLTPIVRAIETGFDEEVWDRILDPSLGTKFSKHGVAQLSLPGTKGYKQIQIYTFNNS